MELSTNTFPYKPLSADLPEIRVLHLLPGKFDDDIKCSLEHVSLDSCPEYTALSYVWGDPKVTKPVKFSCHRSAMSAFTNMWKWWSSQDGKGSIRVSRGPVTRNLA